MNHRSEFIFLAEMAERMGRTRSQARKAIRKSDYSIERRVGPSNQVEISMKRADFERFLKTREVGALAEVDEHNGSGGNLSGFEKCGSKGPRVSGSFKPGYVRVTRASAKTKGKNRIASERGIRITLSAETIEEMGVVVGARADVFYNAELEQLLISPCQEGHYTLSGKAPARSAYINITHDGFRDLEHILLGEACWSPIVDAVGDPTNAKIQKVLIDLSPEACKASNSTV